MNHKGQIVAFHVERARAARWELQYPARAF